MSGGEVGALYVHVPFCAKKCAYCDFSSTATRRDDPIMAAYIGSIIDQLRLFQSVGLIGERCDTAYVGGGTPTLVGAKDLAALIAAIPAAQELTFEANPESLTDEVLDAAVAAGATRVSVGVQSLRDDELAHLGRIHTAREAKERVIAAKGTPLTVSVDLMCAIPRQTEASFGRTLEELIDLRPDHVSVYPLTIEEGTELFSRYEHGKTPFNDEEVQAERMEQAERMLTAAGFSRYEVASYARPGLRCAHNIGYWTGVSYLGLGTAAASMLREEQYLLMRKVCPQLPEPPGSTRRVRLTNTTSPKDMAGATSLATLSFDLEFLTGQQASVEDLMLAMRLTDGVDKSRFEPWGKTLDELVQKGLLELVGERAVPTHTGWLMGNELYGAIWDLAEGDIVEACSQVDKTCADGRS